MKLSEKLYHHAEGATPITPIQIRAGGLLILGAEAEKLEAKLTGILDDVRDVHNYFAIVPAHHAKVATRKLAAILAKVEAP